PRVTITSSCSYATPSMSTARRLRNPAALEWLWKGYPIPCRGKARALGRNLHARKTTPARPIQLARSSRPILQLAAAGRRVAPQVTGDCRGGPTETAPDLLHGIACTLRSAISSRSASDRYRPESGFAENLNIAGGIPHAFRNRLVPTGCDTPASSAASLLLSPAAIQHRRPSFLGRRLH